MVNPIAIARLFSVGRAGAAGLGRARLGARLGAANDAAEQNTPVSSSAISSVSYHALTQRLEITFHSGKTYTYQGVPVHVYQGLMAAGSKGAYFNENIKDNY